MTIKDIRRFEVSMADALNCLEPHMTAEACRACPRYGKSWTCPPFDTYDFETLHPERRKKLLLVLISIVCRHGESIIDFNDFSESELHQIMENLRKEAGDKNGVVYGLASRCDLCRGQCRRTQALPCKFPERVAPSLEAVGFNVSSLLSRFCNTSLQWADKQGRVPQQMTLVAAIAY